MILSMAFQIQLENLIIIIEDNKEPILIQNESVIEGLVQGVGSWVVKTATMFTYLGENIGNIFSFKGCVGNKEENLLNKEEYSTCRQLRYLFNEDNKEIEEYYLKW